MKYISLKTIDNSPIILPGKTSPFMEFDDGFDPNSSDAFGPDKDEYWAPVVVEPEPVVNPILEKAEKNSTNGFDGEYSNGQWVISWSISEQDLEIAKMLKRNELDQAEADEVNQGYVVGDFVFPLTEEFQRLLTDRHLSLDLLISDGEIPAGSEITFSDRNGKQVSGSLSQLRTHRRNFAKAYLGMQEKVVASTNALEAASTVQEVNEVKFTITGN